MDRLPENEPHPAGDGARDLRKRTVRGALWSFAEMFGRYGVTYAVAIYLARLLSPGDYGLIGLAMAFFTIAAVVVEGGFRAALVRKKSVAPADYNTVFYANLAFSFVMYAAVYAVAPHIAKFYGEPLLAPLARLLGLTLITNAMTVVQSARLQREMRFSLLAFITIPAETVSGAAAIALAFKGFGVMSLAVKILLSSFITMVLYRCLVRWRPAFEFSVRSFKELFRVGAGFMSVSVVRALYLDFSVLFIGKVFSAQALGYYSFSSRLINLAANNITTAVGQVSLSSFSKIQDDAARLAYGYRLTLQSAAAAIFPIMVMLAVMAEPLVGLFLGEKWLPAVPYIRILCVTGALAPLRLIGGNIIMLKDAGLYMKIEYAAALTLLAALFLLAPLGIGVFLFGQAAHAALFALVVDFYRARRMDCRFLSAFRGLVPVAASAAVMGGGLCLAMVLTGGGIGIPHCAVMLAAASAAYCACLRIFRVEAFIRIFN